MKIQAFIRYYDDNREPIDYLDEPGALSPAPFFTFEVYKMEPAVYGTAVVYVRGELLKKSEMFRITEERYVRFTCLGIAWEYNSVMDELMIANTILDI